MNRGEGEVVLPGTAPRTHTLLPQPAGSWAGTRSSGLCCSSQFQGQAGSCFVLPPTTLIRAVWWTLGSSACSLPL